MDEAIQKLIEVVEKTAPELWRIGIQQAVNKGIWEIVIFLVFLVVGVSAIFVLVGAYRAKIEIQKENSDLSYYQRKSEENADGWIAVSTFFMVICFPAAIYFLRSGVMLLMNPEYYAIDLLLDLVS